MVMEITEIPHTVTRITRETKIESTKLYVCGFGFDRSMSRVVLIQKDHPPRLAGLYNGVGGKVYGNEAPHDAMVREFLEETGVRVDKWYQFLTLIVNKNNSTIIFFCTLLCEHQLGEIRTTTSEPVGVFPVGSLPESIGPDLKWLIPLALSRMMTHIAEYVEQYYLVRRGTHVMANSIASLEEQYQPPDQITMIMRDFNG